MANLVPGVGIGVKIDFNIFYGLHEAVQTFYRIFQQHVSRDHQFPLTVPDRSANQSVAGDIGLTHGLIRNDSDAIERLGTVHRAERLVFADGKQLIRQ